MPSIIQWLNKPIDNSALVLFRIFFGLLMFFEGIGAILTGWVKETFVEPEFTFNFIGFEFLQVLVGPQMYAVYVLMGLCGLAIMFGWHYKKAIIAFALLWGATYFLQKSHYNNHYYLVWLISLLLIIVPANAYRSLDVKQGRVRESLVCPRWCTVIFMLIVGIVYFYASIAKLYPDWLAGKPVEIWFTHKKFNFFLWGDGTAEVLQSFFHKSWVHKAFSWVGILFDLLVVPAFLWKRTRTIALILSLIFHLTNSAIFHIGVFPYFALAFVIFFYKPETIRRIFFKKKPLPDLSTASLNKTSGWLMAALALFFAVQIVQPLRHHIIPGKVLWTEEGHRLSWRMMLRAKYGTANVEVQNLETGEKDRINLRDYLSREQHGDMVSKPDMIWQFAQRLPAIYKKEKGWEKTAVYVDSRVSVNGRPLHPFTDKTIDIASEKWNVFGHQRWILDPPPDL